MSWRNVFPYLRRAWPWMEDRLLKDGRRFFLIYICPLIPESFKRTFVEIIIGQGCYGNLMPCGVIDFVFK
jgi:hypothetical protein